MSGNKLLVVLGRKCLRLNLLSGSTSVIFDKVSNQLARIWNLQQLNRGRW